MRFFFFILFFLSVWAAVNRHEEITALWNIMGESLCYISADKRLLFDRGRGRLTESDEGLIHLFTLPG